MPRPQTRYSALAPLLSGYLLRQDDLLIRFACPVSAQAFVSRIPRDLDAAQQLPASRRRWREIRMSILRLVDGLNPNDRPLPAGPIPPPSIDAPLWEDWVIRAFQTVSCRFSWDGAHKRFVANSVLGPWQPPFRELIGCVPLRTPAERNILARMLVEVACADGDLGQRERAFFASYLGQDKLALSLDAPTLSPEELSQVPESSRYPLWLIATAMALVDEDLDPAEQDKILDFAQAFSLTKAQIREGFEIARGHIYDDALELAYANGAPDPESRKRLETLRLTLNLNASAAEHLETLLRHRHGLPPRGA